MEPTARLFSCLLCGTQVKVCLSCDRGQVYCSKACACTARQKFLRSSNARYQKTLKGRHLHAARQARYRARLRNKVTDHSSPAASPNVLIIPLENESKVQVSSLAKEVLCCGFCGKTISAWLRNDFLRPTSNKKSTCMKAFPQAP